MAQEIITQTDTPLALPDSLEQQSRRVGRWIALHDSGQIPQTLMEDAKAVLADMETKLTSASRKQFYAQMTPCLDLCAGSGMGPDEREAWFTAAAATLRGIPYDLLERGCAAARKRADHPSKIVPAIIREIEEAWNYRKIERNKLNVRIQPPQKAPWELARENTFDPANRCKPEEAAEIVKQYGFDEPIARDLDVGRDCSKLRQPTKEELEALAAEFKAAHATTPQQDGETQAA